MLLVDYESMLLLRMVKVTKTGFNILLVDCESMLLLRVVEVIEIEFLLLLIEIYCD